MSAVLKPETVEFEATVTSKGQLTLPVALRESIGIMAGTKVKFIQDASGIRFEAQKPISAYFGYLKHLGNIDTTIPKEMDRDFDDILGKK
jgi:AbrB family looped-hinge helix DNA binding protein